MRATTWIQVVALVAVVTSSSAAQNNVDEEIEKLRQHIEELQRYESTGNGIVERRIPGEIGARARPIEPESLVRIYDLGDLFITAPHYEAQPLSDLQAKTTPLVAPSSAKIPTGVIGAGGLGGGGGGLGGGSFDGGSGGRDNRLTLDSLIEAIEYTIDVDSWDPVGSGTIAQLGTTLIISAKPSVHEQIEALIEQLRRRWGTMRTITVKARWLWLTDSELDELSSNERGDGSIDPAAWRKMLIRVCQDEQRPKSYRASVTGHNGQTVHVVAGGQSVSVTGIEPIVGGGEVGYEPVVSLIQEGAVLQVMPTASTNGEYVVLDIHSRINQLHSNKAAPRDTQQIPEAAQDREDNPGSIHGITIDRPRLMNHRLSATIRVPVRKLVLVGGMTFENEFDADQPNLYLFVETSIRGLSEGPAVAAPAPTAGNAK